MKITGWMRCRYIVRVTLCSRLLLPPANFDRFYCWFFYLDESSGVPHGPASSIYLPVFSLPPSVRDGSPRWLGRRTNHESTMHLPLRNEESLFQASVSGYLETRSCDALRRLRAAGDPKQNYPDMKFDFGGCRLAAFNLVTRGVSS